MWQNLLIRFYESGSTVVDFLHSTNLYMRDGKNRGRRILKSLTSLRPLFWPFFAMGVRKDVFLPS